MTDQRTRVRRRLHVAGLVQGVGFRPHVYALARSLDLAGAVWNTGSGVVAEVEGGPDEVSCFCRRVGEEAPPLARVDEVRVEEVPPLGGTGFAIRPSEHAAGRTFVSADVTICDDCLADLTDPTDRRHRHPFVTCTNCGPRFTVTTGLPYDRATTTMAGFPMCAACAREYADPADRRFHAQTVCCPDCGPRLSLVRPGLPAAAGEEALAGARRLLAEGGVVAVKGIGGYHLACDATAEPAVATLRARKRRGGKPFAVLVADLVTAEALVDLPPGAADLLSSRTRPIVLAPRRAGAPALAQSVAPGLADLGVMLPSAPLHHLLLGLPGDPSGPPVLVLTSGNVAGEPIVTDDADALRRLAGIADAWLTHDRRIHVPCDDSVSRAVDGAEAPVRRSRGQAPLPVDLPFETPPALAVGGDLKNTFCLGEGRLAWLSGHVGDMDDLATLTAFGVAEPHLEMLTGVTPEAVAADRHPAYRSRRWAREHAAGRPVVGVQHHHAHVASTMADNGVGGGRRVLGVAFDGTGYGDDGAVWGGEFLVADYASYDRAGHLAYVALPGGDAGVRNPCRMALSHLTAAGLDWDPRLPSVRACADDELALLARQLATGVRCVPTSSMGRLFDAVASLAGIRHRVDHDAQAAMELESRARSAPGAGGYRFGPDADPAPVVAAVVEDVLAGRPPELVAARFQAAVVDLVLAVSSRLRDGTGLGAVTLSGGVFLNAYLTSACAAALGDAGFEVLRHRRVPASDAGLALGQLAVLAHRMPPNRRPGPPEEETPCA
ncbi:carbamoyltransferase HypF [Nocardioides guangzhouensis]|uniref:carbamoyltransferase HypF n=1 Tax=Nocardioides guangzhouensis TaxID=2497878 RepID=UPI001C37C5E0|nr:carbamoyltransferase HypF [Nocardioides guangzhouensis]